MIQSDLYGRIQPQMLEYIEVQPLSSRPADLVKSRGKESAVEVMESEKMKSPRLESKDLWALLTKEQKHEEPSISPRVSESSIGTSGSSQFDHSKYISKSQRGK